MRLFVSIDLPDGLAGPVRELQESMADASGLSFTDPEGAHVTLKFLGGVGEDRLGEIEGALSGAVEAAGVGPFEAAFRGLGAFPSEGYIRVVWLGVGEGGEEMTRLHEAVEERAVALGFDPEEHDFTPHVTLARMRHAGGKGIVQRALGEDHAVGTMRVGEIRLTESELGPDGPVYSTVARFPLPP